MNFLCNSVAFRWAVAWVFIAAVLAVATSLAVNYTGKESLLGKSLVTQYLSLLVFSAPWFLWGEICSRFASKWKEYSLARRFVSLFGLSFMLLVIVFATALVTIDW